MAFADTWHIRSRARKCALTERPFEEGEAIITALFLDPDPESSGYLRQDFSLEAWETRSSDQSETEPKPPFSSWRSKYAAPVVEEKFDPMKKEDSETLLRRLVDEDEEHTENVRYILAVMLERKKILRETDSQPTPDGILRVYEHRKEGDIFIVRDPNIALDQIESIQDDIVLMLEHGGRIPEAETEETEETEETDGPETKEAEG